MSRRHHLPPDALELRDPTRMGHPSIPADDPRRHRRLPPGQPPPVHPVALMEERIVAQDREIQALFVDNQRLAATHVALKQDLIAAKQELRHLSATAATVKTESDAQVREVYEKLQKVQAEVQLIDELGTELAQVRADIEQMKADRKDLKAKLEEVETDLAKVRSGGPEISAIKAEIEVMLTEVKRGRAAVEYEKKMHANNLEQSEVMEKNMISMANEIKKLHAELANAEKRARAAAAAAATATPSPGYAAGYRASETGFAGSSYDPYAFHQVPGAVDIGPYGPSSLRDPYDIPQNQVHR